MNEKELDGRLLKEIIEYFELPDEEKQNLSKFSRLVVEENYGADKMALETLKFYEKVLNSNPKRAPKIAICGYYGRSNLGDEAIFQAISSKICEIAPNARLCVVNSKSPLKILKSLSGVDLFLFGGGSLIQNSTSNASLMYYLTIIGLASLTCNHKIMLANGLGPIKARGLPLTLLLDVIATKINIFDLITVRDKKSQKFLQNLLPNRKIHILPDLALMNIEINNANVEQSSQKFDLFKANLPYYIYVPCSFGLKESKIDPKELANSLLALENHLGARVVLVVMNKKEDFELAKTISKYISSKKEDDERTIFCPKNASELVALLKRAKFVISQRYHGALLGAFSGVPTIPISNDNKMKALSYEILQNDCKSPDILANKKHLASYIEREILRQRKIKNEIVLKIEKQSSSANERVDKILNKYL